MLCVFLKFIYLFSLFLVVGLLGEIIISVRQHDLIKHEQKWNNVKLKWQAEPHLYLFVSAVLSHKFPFFASPTGTTSRSVVPLPKPEPGGTHVRLPVVPNALHRQIPSVHGFSHHWPAALRGNVSALVILITWGEGFSLHCPESSKAMLNCLETGNQLKVDRKEVTRGQEKGIRGEGWMSTKTASLLWCGKCTEVMYAASSASSTQMYSSKQFLLPLSLKTGGCVVRSYPSIINR